MSTATIAFWTRLEQRVAPYNLLAHPFYQAWSRGKLTRNDLRDYAAALGLDVDRFSAEMQAQKYRDAVRRHFRSGLRSGVNGTPTFFINGLRYDGPWDAESLIDALQEMAG